MNIAAIFDRISSAAMGLWNSLSGLSGEMLAVVILGAIGAAISLGCIMVGLVGEWREWAESHLYNRDGD
jgi:hypothetical protein